MHHLDFLLCFSILFAYKLPENQSFDHNNLAVAKQLLSFIREVPKLCYRSNISA